MLELSYSEASLPSLLSRLALIDKKAKVVIIRKILRSGSAILKKELKQELRKYSKSKAYEKSIGVKISVKLEKGVGNVRVGPRAGFAMQAKGRSRPNTPVKYGYLQERKFKRNSIQKVMTRSREPITRKINEILNELRS